MMLCEVSYIIIFSARDEFLSHLMASFFMVLAIHKGETLSCVEINMSF